MRIAVASGKGGTGKTTVAANLAVTLARRGMGVVYADCDVEEPNGHIFMKPGIRHSTPSTMPYPVMDVDICTGCGKCQEICRFNAVVVIGKEPLVFPELCHACGGCVLVCPVNAVSESDRVIGDVEAGEGCGCGFVRGTLSIGQVQSPPLIRDVKRGLPAADVTIVDCPPGTSCPVITAVEDADYVLLVTEPTPFGLHDLGLAVEMVRLLGIPAGVVVNRAVPGIGGTEAYCRRAGVPIVGTLPDDERIACAYSRGGLIIDALPEYEDVFFTLFNDIIRMRPEAASTRKGRQ